MCARAVKSSQLYCGPVTGETQTQPSSFTSQLQHWDLYNISCSNIKTVVMEIHQFVVGLMLTLSAAPWADAQPEDVMVRYNNFLTRHVYGGMHTGLCDSVIRDRHITERPDNNNCKEINTFIQATSQHVRAVCTGQPQGGDFFTSTQTFPVITCKLNSGERRPNCQYRGTRSTRYITVQCDRGWPVHYQEDQVVIG
ncbi:ribonuclease-like 3 [Brachyhypopomus gauderio]|uniref:ribonuclease-like 3 n=1 Tax=Brachyhypopomus gauderio TaxID=698409 RepID=UPI004040F555